MTREELKDYGIKVTQASRTGLIILMYEIAIKYMEEAVAYNNKGQLEEYRKSVNKARSFINELSGCLDISYNIGIELMNLYNYINTELVKAEINKDVTYFSRIIAMLNKLKNSFVKISEQDKSGPVMENTQQLYAGLTYSKDSLNENMYTENINRGFKV